MNQEVDIYTETMAKVYADQGHWSKAVKIYRYLLAMEPLRQDFAKALAEAENKMGDSKPKNPELLVPLFQEWIELLFKNEKLQKLKKLKNMY
jgi:two-component SAPR family response regulator